jgi:DNA-3-methyladenine glycosylase I
MSKKITMPGKLVADERIRCQWVNGGSDLYFVYHDEEWGVPVRDDRRHFEFLILEGAQAGLSWSTVLNKRQAYRRAFADFDYERVARFTSRGVERLLKDAGIIRNRAKIESAIGNARSFIKIRDEFGSFDQYVWRFVDGRPRQNRFRRHGQVPATSRESDTLSKDLKDRGMRFVGSTIMYAHMQAVGMVNDHLVTCFRHAECQALSW